MSKGMRIIEGVGAIILPIVFWALSGVTEILMSEIFILPCSICYFTGKGMA